MRRRYQELITLRVIAADGKDIGRLVDLTTERCGDLLRVEGLLVGQAALLRRIGLRRSRLFRAVPPRHIPWSLVARVDEHIHLRVSSDDLPSVAGDGGPGAAPAPGGRR